MHVITERFSDPLAAKHIPAINLHPPYRASMMEVRDQTGLYKTGIMIHYVIRDVDRGTPIVQRDIECRMSKTLDELTERAHEQEHELVVQGTAMAITKL